MISKALLVFKDSGFKAFVRLFLMFLWMKLIKLYHNVLNLIGLRSSLGAMWILKRQSSDAPSVSLFDYLLAQATKLRAPVTIWVPNFLEKAFHNIAFVFPKGSRIVSYKNTGNEKIAPDLVILSSTMIALIKDPLQTHFPCLKVNFTNGAYSLLSQGLFSGHNEAKSKEIEELLEKQRAIQGDYNLIKKRDFTFKTRSASMDANILHEVEEEYFSWLDNIDHKFDLIVDMGAQIGGFSILSSRLLKEGGKVVSFEPEPRNVDLLITNIKLNSLEHKVIAYPYALSDVDGEASLSVSSDNTGGNKLGTTESSSDHSVSVRTVDSLTFIEPMIKGSSLLKIDVEGWEYPILKRISSILPKFTFVVGELQVSQFGSSKKSLEIIEKAGFEVETKGDEALLLILARRRS